MKAKLIATSEMLGPTDRYYAIQWTSSGCVLNVLYHGDNLEHARKSIALAILAAPEKPCSLVETKSTFWGYAGAIEVSQGEIETQYKTAPSRCSGEGRYERADDIEIPAGECPRIVEPFLVRASIEEEKEDNCNG